jgi:hypothetical protein
VPLTLEEVLHPQEGDVTPESTYQERDAEYLRPIFCQRAARLLGGYLLADCVIDWDVPGVRNYSPDLAVFRDVAHPPVENIGTFRVRAFGGRCVLVVEIVSPDTRERRGPQAARVPPGARAAVRADRPGAGQRAAYRGGVPVHGPAVRADAAGPSGAYPAEAAGAVAGGGRRVRRLLRCGTGERLGDYGQERRAREDAERRVRELESELRRLRGEAP